MRDPDIHPSTLDGESRRRVVHISGDIPPLLDGLVIANGEAAGLGGWNIYDAGGGVYVDGADAILNRGALSSTTARER